MGVRGLLLRRLGERSLGWKEKPSLMLSRTEGATYVKPCGERPGQPMLGISSPWLQSLLWSPWPPCPHQEGLVGTLTEGCVIRTIYWSLPCKACIKLAHVLF